MTPREVSAEVMRFVRGAQGMTHDERAWFVEHIEPIVGKAIRAAEIEALEWAADLCDHLHNRGCGQPYRHCFELKCPGPELESQIRAEIERRKGEVYPKPNPQPVCFMTDDCNCGAHGKPKENRE